MRIAFLLILSLLISCKKESNQQAQPEVKEKRIYTEYSTIENRYQGFHSPDAVNAIAEIENAYFNAYEEGFSPFFGTVWAENAIAFFPFADSLSYFEYYQKQLPDTACPEALHCTLYANKALQAGLRDGWHRLSQLHEKQWGKREYAGWSIAYLLCRYFDWQAFLIIEKHSPEYEACKKAFIEQQKYPVYRQPDIPLQAMLERGKDDQQIAHLLSENEFGWGFSYQGWHTWITRFTDLKECYWGGAPSRELGAYSSAPLFLKTPFMAYHDYASHVICFPPKLPTPAISN